MQPGASILPADTLIERGRGGAIYARSPHALGRYPDRITERLEYWAGVAADRPFLARRDAAGGWRHLSYGDAYRRVRALAQALLDRRLAADRPILILSGNSIEHALLGLAAMWCGVPFAPIAPAYSLLARQFTTLRRIWRLLQPQLVFAAEGDQFERALTSVATADAEIVTCSTMPSSIAVTAFDELQATTASGAVDDAHRRVAPETIAKVLFTSGSTGTPKGVINTQRMLCSNQEMLCRVLPFLRDAAPVLCDWLPWNHTFGGNHNIGIVLYNGGTLYIDDGKPTAAGFEATIANLREIATTAYFNVPRGYDLLVPRLRAEPEFARHFFSRLEMLFCAAASLRQQVADDLQSVAIEARGMRLPFVTGLGATETAPFALCAGNADFTGGRIGVPVPGVELKLAPVDGKLEGRVRGPNVTPGYWRDEGLTAAAFDDEGFYKLGDALGFADPGDPGKGFTFEGRLSEDFKLSTGTWVRVGPLRTRFLALLGDLAQDVVIAGHDRDYVAALIFPNLDACRALLPTTSEASSVREVLEAERVRARFRRALDALSAESPGSSTTVVRAMLMEEPPSLDAHELTQKGSVSQKAVLANRRTLVEQLYGGDRAAIFIDLTGATV